MAEVTLRKSLETKYIFMSETNPWYSNLNMISRKDLSKDDEKRIESLDLLPKRLVDLLADTNGKFGDIHCYGLDVIVEESTLDLYVIDLNDMPSYIGVSGMSAALDNLKQKHYK